MSESRDEQPRFDDGTLFWGVIFGFVIGTITWLLNVPHRGILANVQLRNAPKEIRDQLEHDPVSESLQEGKVMARRRRGLTQD